MSTPPRAQNASGQNIDNLALMVVWIIANSDAIPGLSHFDRFPFGILGLLLTGESIILTILVLIIQYLLVRQAEKRAHLDLQVGLLAEQEITVLIQMVHKLCERAGVEFDDLKHVDKFGHATDVHDLAKQLDEKLPSK